MRDALPSGGTLAQIAANLSSNELTAIFLCSPCFDDSLLIWAAFYHLMFRDPKVGAMKGGKVR